VRINTTRSIALAGLLFAVFVGCRKQDMADQARQDTMDESKFFANGQSARPLIPGTVPQVRQRPGEPKREPQAISEALFAVTSAPPGQPLATKLPFEVDQAHIAAGKRQFDIYCAICHGALGDGTGMIVQRGFPRPPSFYTTRLRNQPVGYYYNVISNGYGAMYSYGDRVKEPDRWNIAAYIRALQLGDPNRIDPDIARAATQPVR